MAKTLQELFVDMVNAKNPGLGMTVADVDFGTPSVYAPADEDDERNTALTLTAKTANDKFKGSKEYHYKRENLTNPGDPGRYTTLITDLITNYDDDAFALQQLNNNLYSPYKLAASDVTITRSEQFDDGGKTAIDITFTVKPENLQYVGVHIIRIWNGKDSLQTKTAELDGFV